MTTLIVGAGPTGLTLAIELARRGVPFRLIDREPTPPETSRALGTQPRTVEVFRIMGIPPGDLQPVLRPRAFQLREGERTVARLQFGDRPHQPSPPVIMNEADTERVLTERLRQVGGTVERGVALRSFRYDGDGVIAMLEGPRGDEEMRVQFLAGCDGATSIVRRQAGIAFTGGRYPEQFLLADLDLDWDAPHDEGTIWLGSEEGIVAAIPLPAPRRWRIIVAVGPAAAGLTGVQAAIRAEEVLRQRAGVPVKRIGEPVWGSAFHIQRRLADHYRAGPVFLAGDAAHVHSPIGGQGMNTGIQDAFNLGWKLALAARDQAAPGLLDTYERERRPVARAVLAATDLGQRLMFSTGAAARSARETLLPAVVQLPPVRDRVLAALSELHITYHDSPLSVDARSAGEPWWLSRLRRDAPRAGDRVPDFDLRSPTGASATVFDMISRGWTALLVASATGGETLTRLDRIARQLTDTAGDLVQSLLVVPVEPQAPGAAPVWIAAPKIIASLCGSGDGVVLVVRPDGYLGYRGRPDQQAELATYLARVFAMRVRRASPGNDA